MEVTRMFEEIRDIMVSTLDLDEDKVTPETNLRTDLDIDSLDLVEFVSEVEDHFGIMIPQDALEGIQTVSDFAAMVEKLAK